MANTRMKPKAKLLLDPREFRDTCLGALTFDLSKSEQHSEFHAYTRDLWLRSYCKKFLLPGDKVSRESKAYAKFLQVNDEMRSFNNASKIVKPRNDVLIVLENAKHLVHYVLGSDLDWEAVFRSCKNSAGTSIGVPFWDTSPERKFRYPISLTSSVENLWEQYLDWDKDLAHAITALNEVSGITQSPTVFTEGSRSCTVPKTDDIDRMIAVEPVINMFFQHGISALMEDKLKRAGLSFSRDPERHRHLAFMGSITNRISTVDFSSMSDRLSLKVAKLLLPKAWYLALCRVRCSFMKIHEDLHELHMISTMGNATTFPLETLVLWAVSVSSLQFIRRKDRSFRSVPMYDTSGRPSWAADVSVFGDDCILPSDAVPLFLEVCRELAFEPNHDKTFFGEEYFRESCGGDFYHGRDVRPPYLEAFPETQSRIAMEAYLYTVINTTIKKYISYFGGLTYVYDKQLLRYLFQCLSVVTDEIKFVPTHFPDDSGVTSLQDVVRFCRCYRIKLSPIFGNKSQMLSFSYLRYEFPSKGVVDGNIRYALALKSLAQREVYVRNPLRDLFSHKKLPPIRNIRKNGKYVQRRSRYKISVDCPNTLSPYVFLRDGVPWLSSSISRLR